MNITPKVNTNMNMGVLVIESTCILPYSDCSSNHQKVELVLQTDSHSTNKLNTECLFFRSWNKTLKLEVN